MVDVNLSVDGIPHMHIETVTFSNTATTESGNTVRKSKSSRTKASRHQLNFLSLPIPNELVFPTELDWSVDELSVLQTVGGNNTINDIRNMSGTDAETLIRGVTERVKAAASSGFGGEVRLQDRGRARNPFKSVFFNGSNNRTFTFTWDFAPRNATHAADIKRFADALRDSVVPEEASSFGVYKIPDSFSITFDEDLKLPTINESVCTAVSENYAPEGPRFHADGYAAFVSITASFMELAVPTRVGGN